eukprot:4255117-Pyramimonas_sp.AAC.1
MAQARGKPGRQIFLQQVADEDGNAHSDPDVCARLLAAHWGAVFEERGADSSMIADPVSRITPIP